MRSYIYTVKAKTLRYIITSEFKVLNILLLNQYIIKHLTLCDSFYACIIGAKIHYTIHTTILSNIENDG